MNRILALLVLACACAGAGAVEVGKYETRLDVAADGTGEANVALTVAGAQAGHLKLPVGFAAMDAFAPREVPPGVVLTPHASKEQSWIDIEFPNDAPADMKIGFTFRIPGVLFVPKPEEGQKSAFPAGSRLLRHSFVNTQETPIASYRLVVRLPDEAMVHMIREQLPKPKRKEFVPRVDLDRFDGRQGALLQYSGLRQGDRTSMELEVVGQRRSMTWLVLLLPLALGYLVAFRDTIRPPSA